jgi:hypothetical protein
MQWLNDIQEWFLASENRNTVLTGIILFISMILALLIGALIGGSVSKRHIRSSDDQAKAAVLAALIDAATEASVWNGLSPQEQIMSDRAVGQIDVRVRLLPVKGAAAAADWAAHQLAEMKRTSATFGYQLDPAVAEFRDRLLLWVNNPGRANKIFARDLERWAFQSVQPEAAAVASQDAWVAQQYTEEHRQDDLSSLLGQTAPAAPPVIAVPVVASVAAEEAPVSATEQLLNEVDGLSALRSPRSDDDDQNLPRVF